MENAKEKKHLSKGKKSIIQYSIIAVCAVGVGVGGGILMKKKFGPVETDYTGFDPELYRADSKALLREYEQNPSKSFTPSELVNIGLEKYRNCENSYSIGVGQAETVVNQTIRSAQIKNGSKYFEEQISRSSMVSLANRTSAEGDTTKLFKGKAKDAETSEYKNEYTSLTSEEYKESWGKTLQEMFIYIISEETVLKDKCEITKKDGKTQVHLELDTDIASYYYKIQMKTMSDLSGLPTFDYLKQTYTFDSDMTLLHCTVDEKYNATMSGITASIRNTLDYYYHANEVLKIPELNEQFNYSVEGETTYE